MGNKKAVIIVGVLAVAVIVGFVALRGTWPPGQGTEGAIGAANRYSSQQITANDVKLQDADIQAFIQSDLFHKLATNTEFRNMVKEASFRDVAANANYQAIVENKAQAQSLGNKDFASYLAKPTTVAMVTSEAYVKVASECNMAEVLRNPQFFELITKTLDNKTTPAEFAQSILANKELDHTFVEYAAKNAAAVMAAMTPALLESKEIVTSLSGAAELLANPKLGQLLEQKPKPFTELVTMEAHEELMKNPTVMGMAFQSDAFQKIVETGAWSELEKGFTTIDQ
jgi:hypothetical protein